MESDKVVKPSVEWSKYSEESKIKHVVNWNFWTYTPVSYTHLDVYKRQLEERRNNKRLVKLGKSESEIRKMLVQVYSENARRKQRCTSGLNGFLRRGNK